MDYKNAGVDIEAGYKSVELMKEHVKKTMRPEVLGGLGGFSGAFSLAKITDGRPCTRRQLAEAMSANAGRHHRMSTLPLKWAGALSPLAIIVPALRPMFGRDALRRSMQTLTFSADKLAAATGLKMYDTLEVIARTATDYPYEEE